jgi:hypothetical protein
VWACGGPTIVGRAKATGAAGCGLPGAIHTDCIPALLQCWPAPSGRQALAFLVAAGVGPFVSCLTELLLGALQQVALRAVGVPELPGV